MAIQKAQIQSSKIIQNPKLHTLQSLKVIRLEHRTSSALPRIDCSLHLANACHKSVGPLARLHHRNRSAFQPGHQDAAVSQEFDPWHSHLDLLRSCVAERTVAGERHLGTYNIVIALNCKKQTTTSLTTQHVANSNTLEDQHTLPSRSLLLVCNNMQQLFFKMPVYNAMQNPGKPLLQHLCLVLIFCCNIDTCHHMSALFSVSLSTCLYHVHRIFLVVFTNPDDVNLHSKGQQQYSIKHFSISQVSHPCGWHGHIVFQLQRKRKPKRQTSKLRCKVGDAQKVMVGFGKEKWSLFDLENLRADTFLGE